MGLARGCIRDIEAAGLHQSSLADVYRGFVVIEKVAMALIAAAAKLHVNDTPQRCASRSAAILYGSVLHAMLTPLIRRGPVGW